MIFHVLSEAHIRGGVGRYTKLLEEIDPNSHKVIIANENTVNHELEQMHNANAEVWLHSLFESLKNIDSRVTENLLLCMHAPVLTCVGGERFLQSSQRICEKRISPFGCYATGLTEKCCTRNPKKYTNQISTIQNVVNSLPKIHFIAFSKYTYEDFICQYPTVAPRTHRLRLFGQDLRKLNPDFSRKDMGEFRILFVGRLINHKGIHLLMQAWIDLVARGVYSELRIIGPEPHELFSEFFRLESKIFSIDALRSRYTRHSWATPNDIANAMAKSDILVVPSIYPEAFGLVGVEALSLGLPAIAFNVGGISEWCVHERTGLLIDEVSSESLRKTLERAIRQPEILQKLSAECRRYFESKFTIKNHLDSIKRMSGNA